MLAIVSQQWYSMLTLLGRLHNDLCRKPCFILRQTSDPAVENVALTHAVEQQLYIDQIKRLMGVLVS